MGWPQQLAVFTDIAGSADYVAVVRILLAAALGGSIGWERERHGRAAGLRTHLLLCVGCALIMLVSLYIPTRFMQYDSTSIMRADPGRMAAQVLSGLGFLGGGAIIVFGQKIRGLTTAACIWTTAAIGLAVGAGYLVPALVTFGVVIFALRIIGRWEKNIEVRDRYITLDLHFAHPGERMGRIRDVLTSHRFALLEHTVDADGPGAALYRLQLRYVVDLDFERITLDLLERLGAEGLTKVQWQ